MPPPLSGWSEYPVFVSEGTKQIDNHEKGNPADVYAAELQRLAGLQARERRRERILGYSKLALAALTLIASALLYRHALFLATLPLPLILFVVLAVMQERLLNSIRYRGRAIAFYERDCPLDGSVGG